MIIYSSKYYTKYNQIVKHYKDLNLKKSDSLYTESHHILPKSMGGANNKENLVRIPARVHFLLHWMLVRIYRTPEMAHALNMMCMNKTEMRYISKSFTYAKALHAKEMRAKPSINKGKKLSDETKAKIGSRGQG